MKNQDDTWLIILTLAIIALIGLLTYRLSNTPLEVPPSVPTPTQTPNPTPTATISATPSVTPRPTGKTTDYLNYTKSLDSVPATNISY